MGCLHFIRTRIWCNVSENVEGSSDLHKTHTGCKGKLRSCTSSALICLYGLDNCHYAMLVCNIYVEVGNTTISNTSNADS